MSIRTPVCELLGIERPIVQAPLSADPRLPAAVANAGALGSIALWWADDAGDLVRDTAALTDRPFAGNFVLTADQHRRLDQALSAGLRIVSFLWGDPHGYVDSVHDAGGLVLHTSGAPRKHGVRSDLGRTLSLRKVGRPAGTYGVVSQHFRWCQR
jgi:nitronate monooxygenase